MPYKYNMIFQLTTAPEALGEAQPHTGGWSEGWWWPGNLRPDQYEVILNARAGLLPKQAAIVGMRVQQYTVSGNRLIPGGSGATKFLKRGNGNFDCDIPQMALECSTRAPSTPNVGKLILRGIPDNQVGFGEYQPTDAFKTRLNEYFDRIITPGGWAPGLFFLGRNLALPSAKVQSIAGALVTLDAALAGVTVGQTFVIFKKVRDDNKLPVKGSFLVTAQVGATLTLQGLNKQVSKPSGTLRKDEIDVYPMTRPTVGRISVKKVGRPSQSYRGRASRRR